MMTRTQCRLRCAELALSKGHSPDRPEFKKYVEDMFDVVFDDGCEMEAEAALDAARAPKAVVEIRQPGAEPGANKGSK